MTFPKPQRYLWVWLIWLIAFYSVWLWLVFGIGHWSDAKSHWPIALAMALGSYVAGSSPMGGGTVGFPVLVLVFDLPATLGRDFSFAIQAIGMTSASIYILCQRQPVAWMLLKGAMLGSVIGTSFGILFIAPLVPELWIKVLFAVVWASFGLLHLYRFTEISRQQGLVSLGSTLDIRVGFVVGLLAGATVASVTGVGIDMVVYAALVLLCRADLKIAIPTSVIIMAFTSIVGVAVKSVAGNMHPGVYENWLAAAPVVALGAPLGVFVVNIVGRKPILLFVVVLCLIQFVWTCYVERAHLALTGIVLSCAAVCVFLFGFEKLRAWGAVMAGERQAKFSEKDQLLGAKTSFVAASASEK